MYMNSIRRISTLPLHKREQLRQKYGKDYDAHLHYDALVEITDNKTELTYGTFSDILLREVNDGYPIEDIFGSDKK